MRSYGKWAGNELGRGEGESRCVVQVFTQRFTGTQCPRKRGHGPDGLYCKQHGRMAEEGSRLNVPDPS